MARGGLRDLFASDEPSGSGRHFSKSRALNHGLLTKCRLHGVDKY
jgi:hypothetical protein